MFGLTGSGWLLVAWRGSMNIETMRFDRKIDSRSSPFVRHSNEAFFTGWQRFSMLVRRVRIAFTRTYSSAIVDLEFDNGTQSIYRR